MSRTGTHLNRALTVIALVVGIGVLFSMAPEPAPAAGETGYRAAAEVFCSPGSMSIRAFVGRNAGFSGQSVAYRHVVRNIDTGEVTPLTVNGQYWVTRWDNHNFAFSVPWLEQGSTYYWNSLPHGRYEVFTAYGWANGVWTYDSWFQPLHYTASGGTYPYCQI